MLFGDVYPKRLNLLTFEAGDNGYMTLKKDMTASITHVLKDLS